MSRPEGPAPAPVAPRDRARKGLLSYGLVAVICYLPIILTKPGVVSDDTKTYLYYDPGRFTKAAASIWSPAYALGTVTHQNVGYLFPMGPFFWASASLHIPMWLAQRLWLGTILFAAAAGVLYLCHVLGIDGVAPPIAALAYSLAPYTMQYTGRISVILLPFSGLPWMLAFIALSTRYRGWRYPALFALVVAIVSGINASSVVYVGAAPILWILYSAFVLRELTVRQALGVLLRVAGLTLLVSLWWLAGLSIEGLYGVDVLKYTESVQATSSASAASEVLRGLGYWYFYGADKLGLWTNASDEFTYKFPILVLSYFVPVAAFVSAAFVRWRHRAFFVVLVAVGMVLSVGPHPFSSPTLFGALDKAFMTKTTIGLALRSTDRATPLVTLGLAMLLGLGVSAAVRVLRKLERPRLGLGVVGLAGVLVLAANAPLLAGRAIISQFSQPSSPPAYVLSAAKYLDSTQPGTRVYALPGDDFAAYRYGDTVDPIWPALLTRPYVTHEQQIYGSLETANLLYAIDNPLQQGTMDWQALAPVARLMSAGNVLVEYDEQYERYDAPRPAVVQHDLATTPPGLSDKVSFGAPSADISKLPMIDETYFGIPENAPPPSPLVVYTVSDPRPIVRAESLEDPLVMAGDNVGIVEAADDGLLAHNPTIVFVGTLDETPTLEKAIASQPADLVLTDTNRREAYEWNSLSENTGYTETATERADAFIADDPGFNLFPKAPVSSYTTSVLTNVKSVTASSYGELFTLLSEYRPANAVDGNVATSWQTEGTASQGIVGQWWQLQLRHEVSANSVRLTQPIPQRNAIWLTNQYITQATLTFDGKDPEAVTLGPQSRTPAGQVVTFPRHKFGTLRITIDATNDSGRYAAAGASGVGFAEVDLGNIHTTQVISLPTDLLSDIGTASSRDRLSILLERDRVDPVPPREDPEPYMIRQWTLPTARSFSLVGTARLSDAASDQLLDRVVGRHAGTSGDPVAWAASSSRMPADLLANAGSTLDDNPNTVWMPGLGTANRRSWLAYGFERPLRVDHLTLQVSSDREHSIPRVVVVSAGGVSRTVTLPVIKATGRPGALTTVHISFPAVTGVRLEIRFARVKVRNTKSYETGIPTGLPIGIARVSIPGASTRVLPADIPDVCRNDLLQIDGRPIWVRVSGSASGALAGAGLGISLCGPDKSGFRLPAGKQLLVAANGAMTGFDLDELALDSAPGGAAVTEPAAGGLVPAAPADQSGTPHVSVLSSSSTEMHLHVAGARPGKSFMLVLGESYDKGWTASVDGGPSLGKPVLVDGFANGWRVSSKTIAAIGKGGFDVTLSFAPQHELDVALLASLAVAIACVIIVVLGTLRRRRRKAKRLAPFESDPFIVWPVAEVSPRRGRAGTAVTVVGAGVVAYVFAGLVAAVVVAAALLFAMTRERGRLALTLGALVAVVVGVGGVFLQELAFHYTPGPGWPAHFNLPSTVVWAAVALLAADAGIELVRAWRLGKGLAPAASAEGGEIQGPKEAPG